MCLAQDRGAAAPKAVALHTPSKLTLDSLLLAGHASKLEPTLDCDATLTTVGTDESQHSRGANSPRDDDVEVALAHTFDLDLLFDQVPTGGIISLPRSDRRDTRSTSTVSSPAPSTAPESPLPASLDPSPPGRASRWTSPTKAAARPARRSLHVECAKPPPSFPESSYSTPKASSRGGASPLSPPPTPKHGRLTHAVFFDCWPENLMIPRLT